MGGLALDEHAGRQQGEGVQGEILGGRTPMGQEFRGSGLEGMGAKGAQGHREGAIESAAGQQGALHDAAPPSWPRLPQPDQPSRGGGSDETGW